MGWRGRASEAGHCFVFGRLKIFFGRASFFDSILIVNNNLIFSQDQIIWLCTAATFYLVSISIPITIWFGKTTAKLWPATFHCSPCWMIVGCRCRVFSYKFHCYKICFYNQISKNCSLHLNSTCYNMLDVHFSRCLTLGIYDHMFGL